jgi:hypothetical protein
VWHSIRSRVGDVARTLPSGNYAIGVVTVEPFDEILSVDGGEQNASTQPGDSTGTTL